MYLADYHTHSRISPDAAAPMEELAAAAAAAGLDEICFTDHFEPVEWSTDRPRQTLDWAALTAEYADVTARWGGRIGLKLGLELGDAFMDFANTERLMALSPELDFVIGSVHMLSKAYGCQDLSCLREDSESDCRNEITDYLEQALKLAIWGKFNVLGHLTLPLRYMNEKRGHHATFDGFESEVSDIFRALIQNGCGIEVNTNRGNTPLPDGKWLRLYRSLGGEIVTLGSDAHRPQHVGCAIREGQELLRECGFERFCTFRRKSPIWHAL